MHVSEMVVVDTNYRHPPTFLQVTCTLTRYCKNVGAWCYILCQQLPFQRHAPWCTCTSLCMYMQAEVCAITDLAHLGGGGGGGGGHTCVLTLSAGRSMEQVLAVVQTHSTTSTE